MNLDLIEAQIVKNLSDVQIGTPPAPAFQKVYDYEPQKMPQLPAATLYFDGFRQDDITVRSKRVFWRWIIRAYVPLRDAEAAQNTVKMLTVNCRKELAKDPQLGENCLFHQITQGDTYAVLEQNNPHLMLEMTLEAATNEPY